MVAACVGCINGAENMLKMTKALRAITRGFAVFLACRVCTVFLRILMSISLSS